VNAKEHAGAKPKVGKHSAAVALALSLGEFALSEEELEKHKAEQLDDDVRALNRQEWLQCLVRIAIMRYMLEGRPKIPDASRAVTALIENDLLPNLGGAALHDANEFRQQACYTEKTTHVLLEHEASLRALFTVAANPPGGGGVDVANKAAATLLSHVEWMQLVRALDFIDSEFTVREASLCFLWSRMRVINDSTKRSKLKMESLCVEDFYEAVIHVAFMKAMPTDEQLAEAGCRDAGEFLLRLKESPTDHAKWVDANAVRWDDEARRQPIDRCLAGVLALIVRAIKLTTTAKDKRAAVEAKPLADLVLTTRDVERFLNGGGLLGQPEE